MESGNSRISDELLQLLEFSDDQGKQEALGIFVQERIAPAVGSVLGRLLGVFSKPYSFGYEAQEAEDISAQSISLLLERLSLFLASPQQHPIGNILALTVTVTRRTCIDYWRRRYPEQWRLREQLRYLLQKQPSFALWKADGVWFCGYKDWTGKSASKKAARRLEQLRQNPQALTEVEIHPLEAHRVSLVRLTAAIFNLTGEPVAFNDLVKLLAAWRGLEKQTDQLEDSHLSIAEPERQGGLTPADARVFLQQMWRVIETLSVPQRRALLLNLQYEGEKGLLTTLVLSSIASFGEVARALDMSLEQLSEIWNTLPWDDNRIGQFLGLTRQQVINLRRAARRILSAGLSKPKAS